MTGDIPRKGDSISLKGPCRRPMQNCRRKTTTIDPQSGAGSLRAASSTSTLTRRCRGDFHALHDKEYEGRQALPYTIAMSLGRLSPHRCLFVDSGPCRYDHRGDPKPSKKRRPVSNLLVRTMRLEPLFFGQVTAPASGPGRRRGDEVVAKEAEE